jgi:hypothetical protein
VYATMQSTLLQLLTASVRADSVVVWLCAAAKALATRSTLWRSNNECSLSQNRQGQIGDRR